MCNVWGTRLAISRDSTIHDGNLVLNELHLYGSSRLGMMQMQDTLFHYTAMRMYDLGNTHTPLYSTATITQPTLFDSVFVHQRGSKVYKGTNHLGNILVTYSDKRLTECQEDTIYRYVADVKSQTDYSAFHALLPDRQWYSGNDSSAYRFGGSNGQEKDDEIYGVGNSYSAEFWQFDPRLGIRWNADPVVKPFQGGYVTFSNSPITLIDPKGDDDYYNRKGQYIGSVGENTGIMRVVDTEDVFKQAQLSCCQQGKIIEIDDNIKKFAWYTASNSYVTGREHTMLILFDPDKALVYAELDPAGTASKDKPYISTSPNKSGPDGYDEIYKPIVLLATLHGHPPEKRSGLHNISNVSEIDAETAKEYNLVKYAVDAYRFEHIDSSIPQGSIHRANLDGSKDANIGVLKDIGAGEGKFNLGKDALERSGGKL